jgi:hypothetical protein
VIAHPFDVGDGLQIPGKLAQELVVLHLLEQDSLAWLRLGIPMGFHGKMENNLFPPLVSLLSKDFGVRSEREDGESERDIPMKDLLRHLILAAKVIDHNSDLGTDCNFWQ